MSFWKCFKMWKLVVKSCFYTCPKHFGLVQTNLDLLNDKAFFMVLTKTRFKNHNLKLIMTVIWWHDDILMTVWWQPDDGLLIVWWQDKKNQSDDSIMMIWWLYDDSLMMVWWRPDDTDDGLMTLWWCSDEVMMMT